MNAIFSMMIPSPIIPPALEWLKSYYAAALDPASQTQSTIAPDGGPEADQGSPSEDGHHCQWESVLFRQSSRLGKLSRQQAGRIRNSAISSIVTSTSNDKILKSPQPVKLF
ncbi:MAG: hypothetical protein ACK562_07230 [Acidobacteriota bacterium]